MQKPFVVHSLFHVSCRRITFLFYSVPVPKLLPNLLKGLAAARFCCMSGYAIDLAYFFPGEALNPPKKHLSRNRITAS